VKAKADVRMDHTQPGPAGRQGTMSFFDFHLFHNRFKFVHATAPL